MEDIIIIGAGGIGKETAMIIEEINNVEPTWNLLGFLDDNKEVQGKEINGYIVLGDVNSIRHYKQINAVCAVACPEVKKRIIKKLSMYNVDFPNIIHPSVRIPKTTTMGEGVIIYPGVIVTTNIQIGKFVVLSPGSCIGHESSIEDYSSILWNVSISGNVKIGQGCLVGTGSTIIQNVKIGKFTTIGAGAVVLKDLPQNCTAVGIPAKIIKYNYTVEIVI